MGHERGEDSSEPMLIMLLWVASLGVFPRAAAPLVLVADLSSDRADQDLWNQEA